MAKKVKLTSESSTPGILPAVSQKEVRPLDLGRNDANVHKDVGSGEGGEYLFAVSNYIAQEKTANGVTTNLADFVNKLLVNKLEDSKNIYLFEKQTGISSSE